MRALPFLTFLLVCAAAGAQSEHGGTRESRIPVHGAELYCREVGRGTPMIVLHGGPDFDTNSSNTAIQGGDLCGSEQFR